jgi:RNA polymerase sigma-70 factor, ECF subfamily
MTTDRSPALAPTPAQQIAAAPTCLEAFQRELDYIYRTFRRLGIGPSEVDDLAQDLFLCLVRSWSKVDHQRPLRPYLFGIAVRMAMAHRRKRGREVGWGKVTWGMFEVVDSAPGPECRFQSAQTRAFLLAALQRIPLARRAVLVMHELDGIPVAEVASTLSIPRFTVYSRLRKARRELERAMRKMLEMDPRYSGGTSRPLTMDRGVSGVRAQGDVALP